MQILFWKELSTTAQADALRRPARLTNLVQTKVRDIIDTVKAKGDAAILEYTRQFDGVDVKKLAVDASEINGAWRRLEPRMKDAMCRAYENIEKFHGYELPQDFEVEIEPGLICQRLVRPIDCVGIYVPGGSAPLFSSLLMAAIPAMLAAVPRIAVASPPGEDGKIAPVTLAAAKLCGVDEVFCMGGAQAIAAFAFGTKSVPKADKLFGPGNQWVVEAKAQVTQLEDGPGIDLPAGPSEVMVLADDEANPVWVAADLLSQAEHDPQAQVIMLTLSKQMVRAVYAAVLAQAEDLPRAEIANKALKNAQLIVVQSREQMVQLANRHAPEHLIMQIAQAEELVPQIRNAGSVFVGAYTPEALGDYASGTNHVLPTAGAARSFSGLGVESFVKFVSVQSASASALRSIGPEVEILARLEGLEAHARAISLRTSGKK